MQERWQRAAAVVAIAVVGLGLSLTIENVHRNLTADVTYASFCNVNSSVNCDVVLTSRYAQLGGVSVAILAAFYYLALLIAGVAVVRTPSASQRATLANAIFGAACIGLLFSLYLAIVSVTELNTICLLCSGLYLVAIGMLVAAWWLRRGAERVHAKDSAARARHDRLVWFASGIAVALLLVTVGWEASSGGNILSAAQIQQQRPDFYRYFFAQPVVEMPLDARHARGAASAPVTIVSFSDFGCGHCAAFDRRIGDLLRGRDDVRLIFRHFPLDSKCNPVIQGSGTGERCIAATAGECAAEQNQFWQYGRLLFEHQPNFAAADLRRYAGEVGMDLAKFDECVSRGDARARVENDAKVAASLGVRSTPTLFINGRRFEGDPGANLGDALVLALAKN